MAKQATSKKGSMFIQPEGPNTAVHYLGCHTLGDLIDGKGGTSTPIFCWDPSGDGWEETGNTEAPPDKMSFTIDTRVNAAGKLDWTEKVSCPFSVYALLRDCGRRDTFGNNIRAWVVPEVKKVSTTYSGLATMAEDVEQMMSTTFEASPTLIKVVKVGVSQQLPSPAAGAGLLGLNDICFNVDERCVSDCGDAFGPCERGFVVGDAGLVPPIAGELQQTTDSGDTWAVAAAAPFAANEGIAAVTRFYVGRTTLRVLVGEYAVTAGGQGQMAYSDDNGATWTIANIGGAVTNDGSVSGGTLFSFDEHNIWCAGNNGYIWKSTDAGVTWTAYEEGVIVATAYMFVDFADELHGIAGAAGDIIALTDNGGLSWTVSAGVPGEGDDILCGNQLDENRLWVGTDEAKLWYSNDAGATWTRRTGFVGDGVGDIEDMEFVNDHVAWMTRNDAAELATVYRTIDGGLTWDAITTPVNRGINALWACDENHCFFCGEPTVAPNSFIAYAQPA